MVIFIHDFNIDDRLYSSGFSSYYTCSFSTSFPKLYFPVLPLRTNNDFMTYFIKNIETLQVIDYSFSSPACWANLSLFHPTLVIKVPSHPSTGSQ